MADEELAPAEGGEETLLAPEEGQGEETQETTEEQQPNPIEQLASELGWAPKDQFRGDPEAWKPADEFIRASRDINQSLSRELRSVRDQVSRMETVSSQILRDKIAERDAYWAEQQAKAVDEGDHQAVDRIVSERLKLRNQAQPANDTPPETQDFVARNKWFGTGPGADPLATVRAQEICQGLANAGVPVSEQLKQVERAIRKEFPELFPAPAKPPAGVQTATTRTAATGSRKKGFADMPAESQQMAKQYLKEHGVPLERFAESYWNDQGRKVG